MEMYNRKDVLKCTDPNGYGYYLIINDDGKYMTGIKLVTESALKDIEGLKSGFKATESSVERVANIFIGIFLIRKDRVIQKLGEIDDVKYANIIGCLVSFCMGDFSFSREGGIKYSIKPYSVSININQILGGAPINTIQDVPAEDKSINASVDIPQENQGDNDGTSIVDILSQKYKVTSIKKEKESSKKNEKPKRPEPLPWFEKPTQRKRTAKDFDEYNTNLMRARELEHNTKLAVERAEEKERQEAEKQDENTITKKKTKQAHAVDDNGVCILTEEEQKKWNELYHAYVDNVDSDIDKKLDIIVDLFGNKHGLFCPTIVRNVLILKKDSKPKAESTFISKDQAILILTASNSVLVNLAKELGIGAPSVNIIKKALLELMSGKKLSKTKHRVNDEIKLKIMEDYTNPDNPLNIYELSAKYNLNHIIITSVLKEKYNGSNYSERKIYSNFTLKELIESFDWDSHQRMLPYKDEFMKYDNSDLELFISGNKRIKDGDDFKEEFKYRMMLNKICAANRLNKLFNIENDTKLIQYIDESSTKEIRDVLLDIMGRNNADIMAIKLKQIAVLINHAKEFEEAFTNSTPAEFYNSGSSIMKLIVEIRPSASIMFIKNMVTWLEYNFSFFNDKLIDEIKSIIIEYNKTAPPRIPRTNCLKIKG